MVAANSERINIVGAILVRLSGLDDHGRNYTAPIMVYISSSTKRFYLSREALIQLGVISKDFPRVGAAMESCSVERRVCGYPVRSLPPERPKFLPFPCTPENITKMKKRLIGQFSASTFNRCPHQQLTGMTGPDIKIHVDPKVTSCCCSHPSNGSVTLAG